MNRNTIDESQVCFFFRLPNEMILEILQVLPIEALTNLSMVNTFFRDFIISNFIQNFYGYQSMIQNDKFENIAVSDDDTAIAMKVFAAIGKLCSQV